MSWSAPATWSVAWLVRYSRYSRTLVSNVAPKYAGSATAGPPSRPVTCADGCGDGAGEVGAGFVIVPLGVVPWDPVPDGRPPPPRRPMPAATPAATRATAAT